MATGLIIGFIVGFITACVVLFIGGERWVVNINISDRIAKPNSNKPDIESETNAA